MGHGRHRTNPRVGRLCPPRALTMMTAIMVGLGGAVVTPGAVAADGGPARSNPRFPAVDVSVVQGAKLYDLGVADANGDGNLDVFSINHKFDSSFLLGDGNGGLAESTAALGLNPTPDFPGFEALRRDPERTSPGLYVYATDRDEPRDPLHIDAVGLSASGRIAFASPDLQIESTGGAEVSKRTMADGSTAFDFSAEPGEEIDVSVDHVDLPITVSIDLPTDPALIRVGADAVGATSRSFELNLIDRHAYAFGDYDSDGATDLFIVSGGLGGDISEPFFTPLARDELLFSRSARFLNGTDFVGLVKGDCRGRQAEVADIDGDGDLDLLESCEESTPRIYAGDGGGRLTQVAGPPALGDTYRLLDLIGDRRPELLAADGNVVSVWRSVGGAWSLAQQVPVRNGAFPVEGLSLGDLEGDGDLDVLVPSAGGNTILRADGGLLRAVAPRRLGLPETSRAATFVDFDNDGDLDVHLVPSGLHEQVKGTFKRTRALEFGRSGLGYVIDNWADLDNDGRREPLISRGRDEFSLTQAVDLRRNRTRGGHWLEIDLVGPPANAQAIGARVRVDVSGRSLYGWVGQSDDSRLSTGHYRLYFGLGVKRGVKRVVVSWPDGTKRMLGQTRGDRVLAVPYSGPVRQVAP